MNFLERITNWIRADPPPQLRPEFVELREIVERGRRYKRLAQFDEALSAFEQAQALAEATDDRPSLTIITLHRADVMTHQKRWDETEHLLLELKHEAAYETQPAHYSYVLSALGVLAQERGDWAAARGYYEHALKTAQDASAAGAEGRAQGHLADIYLHDGNASYASHLLREALPKLNASGDIELSSYFVGRLGEAAIASGQQVEGRQLLGRALRLAEHMEYRLYERMWRIALAEQAAIMGKFDEARRLYLNVLELPAPLRTPAEDSIVLCHLSKTCLRLLEVDDALEYAQRAVNILIPDMESGFYARAQGALGVALRAHNQFAEAIPPLEYAVQHYGDITVTDADQSDIDLLRNLAAAQAETSGTESASDTYKRALDIGQARGLRLDVAGTQRDIGTLHFRNGHPHEAIKAWMTALDIYDSERQYARVARLYCDIGNLRKQLGQGKRAMKDYEQALMALNSADDEDTRGIVLANAATAYIDQGDVETAELFLIESIKIAQKLGDRHAEATRRGNYGWFLLSTGRIQRAMSTLEHAMQQSQELGLTLAYAVQVDNIGRAFDESGAFEVALQNHERALALMTQAQNPMWQAMIGANLAHTLTSLNRLDEAQSHFEQALDYGRKTENAEIMLRALHGLGRIALKRGDLAAAAPLIAEAVMLARKATARRLLADALTVQSELQARTDHPAEAAESWEEARSLLVMLRLPAAQTIPAWLTPQP